MQASSNIRLPCVEAAQKACVNTQGRCRCVAEQDAVLQLNTSTMHAGLQEGEAQSHAEVAALKQEMTANRPPLIFNSLRSDLNSI